MYTHELFFLSGYPDVPLVVSEAVKGLLDSVKVLECFVLNSWFFNVLRKSNRVKVNKYGRTPNQQQSETPIMIKGLINRIFAVVCV